jgi:phosphoglycerate dehydrogenase-like enzyme
LDVRGVGRQAREHDPYFRSVVASSELANHVGWADHLVLAAPLTPHTRGLINAEVLSAMKPKAHLINVGRGALIDEAELVSAFNGDQISHASLDAFLEEPLPKNHPFWAMDNVSISAHMSGDVHGWRDTLADQFLDNLRSFAAGQQFPIQIDKARGYAVETIPGSLWPG